jgi:hypothetical protein
MKGLGGGYRLSPAGGMGRKSLLTRGSAGGVYFFDGIEANGFFSSFLGDGSSLKNRATCRTKKIIPTTHSPTTPASSQRIPNADAKNHTTKNKIPKKG